MSVSRRQLGRIPATIYRTWEQLPADAVLSTSVLVQLTGAHWRTITRHAQRGLLRSSISVTKADAERWLARIAKAGGIKRGRPRK